MKTKITAMALTAAAAFFAGSLAVSADSLGTVTADALNIRSAPTTESVVLGQLPYGTNITLTDKLNNWYVINYNGSNAYISADYINITEAVPAPEAPEAPAAPAAPETPASSAAETPQAASEGNEVSDFCSENTDETNDIPSYAGSQVPGEILVETAKQFIGTPYVYGGMSPDGFDCSGLVKYCYSKLDVDINRVACDQAKNGYEVSREDMKPGDILCFASSVGGSYIGHTGIYVGNGYFIHSPRTGYSVEIIPLATGTFSERLTNIRRIFD